MPLAAATRANGRPVLAVVVADEVARPLVEGRGLAQLLGDPGVGRVPRHADMDHPARAERDDEEGVERAEEQVGDRQEVAGPGLVRMVAQEGRPASGRRGAAGARRACGAGPSSWRRGCPVFSSSPRMRSAPHSRLAAIAPDQRDRLVAPLRSTAFGRRRLILRSRGCPGCARPGDGWPAAPGAPGRPGCSAGA